MKIVPNKFSMVVTKIVPTMLNSLGTKPESPGAQAPGDSRQPDILSGKSSFPSQAFACAAFFLPFTTQSAR